MSRNRRKPRVVIPTNVDELIATAMRVAGAVASSIISAMTNVSELSQRILTAANNARNQSDAARIAYETSQEFVRMRSEVCDAIKDRLIQIRDYAYATDGRTSPGMIGFEVVQTTSNDGRARVMIPANPDQFLALASRVNQSVLASDDQNLIAMAQGLGEQIEIATEHQSRSIQLREQWQLELDRRQTSTTQLTVMLREVRDLAFAAAGPYRYESVSTTGLIVQSAATQGDGNGQPVENWSGENSAAVSSQRICNGVNSNPSWRLGDPIPNEIATDSEIDCYTHTFSSLGEPIALQPSHNEYEPGAHFVSENEPPQRIARLDDVLEAFLACEREKNGTDERTVDELVQILSDEFPEASRDQFVESDWLASSVAMASDPVNVGGQVSTVFLAGGGVRIETTGGVNTGCAFTAYDEALSTSVATVDGGVEFQEDQGPEVLNVVVLSERFRACLMSSFDGVPTSVLSDGTPIGSVDEIADSIRASAGIPADLIREEEFLGNLPFGELAAFCGQFAWNFVSSLGQPPTFPAELLIDGFMNARGDGVQLSVDDFNVQSGDQLTLEQWIEAVLSFDPVQFDRNNAIEIFMAARAEQTADAQQLIGALGFDDDGTLTGQVTMQQFFDWVAASDPNADPAEINQLFRIYSETLPAEDLALELGNVLGESFTADSIGFQAGQEVNRDEFIQGALSLGNSELNESMAADVFSEVFNTANPIQ